MLRILFVILSAAASCGVLGAANLRKFTIVGKIDGLQKGDTLRFERVLLPGWETEPAFEVVVRKPGAFRYRGTQEHDQLYRMTYRPVEGRERERDRSGEQLIVTDGDRIRLDGTAEDICYSVLSGGIYDEPELRELLRVEDSLGCARSGYLKRYDAAMKSGDTAGAKGWLDRFNLFYEDNPGYERQRAIVRLYRKNHPEGTVFLLVRLLPELSDTPVDEARAIYDGFSTELKESYFGRLYADRLAQMERLAPGRPAPAFSLATTDGRTVTEADFRGNYLLVYHWGLCPGSMQVDGLVRALYKKYKDRGLQVVGLTESIARIRELYEKMPEDRPTPLVGISNIRPILGRMLEHGWTEAELETDHPENSSFMETYAISGWPFFVFIGPDGRILARGYWEGFEEARTILEREVGE